MMRISIYLVAALPLLAMSISAQQSRQQSPKPPALPADMDCEGLKGDKEIPPNAASTILKRGADYYLCKSKSQGLLARARTAAVAVRSTQTISCGDGSSDDCLREDKATEGQIEDVVNRTDLWRYFEKVTPLKADIIVQFVADNRASSSSQIILQVQDSDSGTWLYYEPRTNTDLENDVSKLIDHFLTKTGRAPLMSKVDMEKARQCALVADQLSALQSEYQMKRSDYDFKNAHPLDAQMDECKLHWAEWVCLKRGASDGLVSYAEQWNESGQELNRKLSLEYEELKKFEQQMAALSQSTCAPQAATRK